MDFRLFGVFLTHVLHGFDGFGGGVGLVAHAAGFHIVLQCLGEGKVGFRILVAGIFAQRNRLARRRNRYIPMLVLQ